MDVWLQQQENVEEFFFVSITSRHIIKAALQSQEEKAKIGEKSKIAVACLLFRERKMKKSSGERL